MKFSKKILSQTVIQLCLAKKIDHIIISPGSRNAPLTIGFTEDPAFKNFSIVDERCAAFFALGIAQQLRKPVALVCTSGSALLNYYPAIAEAYYSNIPLVIISSDRPGHLVEIGDGQTIKQENVFSNHIFYNANCKEGEEYQSFNEAEINNALNLATKKQGPVHINVPFSEPLYETVEIPLINAVSTVIDDVKLDAGSDNLAYKNLIEEWNKVDRKMILVGVLSPNSLEQQYLNILAQDDSVVILTETTSNLHHDLIFPAIDQLIAPLDKDGFEMLKPDLLLTFGGFIVSKKIKAFLREYSPQKHYHIDLHKGYNTFFKLNHHFRADVNLFMTYFLPEIKHVKSDYRNFWLNVRSRRLAGHKTYLHTIPFSDFKVFNRVFEQLPENIQLQLANSATVRYAQLFDLHDSLHVYCNRGTSGIDGSTSTAIGAAYASNQPVVFITGDLSFFYDSNALWNNYIPKNFRIIIVNNSGGGIFRILPGNKDSDNFSKFFETNHQLTAEKIAELYGFEYSNANSEASVEHKLEDFFNSSDTPKILEIFTPPTINDKVLLDYFEFIR